MTRAAISYAFGVALFAAIGTFLFGYDTGIAITIIAFPSWNVYMKMPTPPMIGAISSAYAGGECVGMIMQMAIADRLGRIRFLQLLCVLTLIGTIIQTASIDIGMFIAGRAVTGFGVGGMVTTIPLYLSEIAPPKARGFVAGLGGLGIAFGLMVSSWIGFACSYAPYGQLQWRLPVALQIPWTPILFVGLATFMPESPRHLIRNGRIDQARIAFAKVHTGVDPVETQKEFALMCGQIDYEQQHELKSYRELFRRYNRRIIVAISIALMAILTGAPVVGFFQVIIYKALGMKDSTIMILAAARGTLSFLSVVFITCFLLDQWGRRKLILWGMGLSAAILIYCAVMQMLYQDTDNEVGKGFTVLGFFVFAIVNGGVLESVCPMYNAEILPIALRSKVIALAAATHFAVTVGFTQAAPSAFATIRQNYYYVFVACGVVFWAIGYFWFPETKNKTLEEIAAAFGDKVVEIPEERSHSDVVLIEEEAAKGQLKHGEVRVEDRRASA